MCPQVSSTAFIPPYCARQLQTPYLPNSKWITNHQQSPQMMMVILNGKLKRFYARELTNEVEVNNVKC